MFPYSAIEAVCTSTKSGHGSTLHMSPAMATGIADRFWSVGDFVALWEPVEGGKNNVKMNRPLEIASGIGVFLTSVLSAMAVFKMIFYYQQSTQKVPIFSILSLCLTGLAILLSFVGAFILLSWAKKSK
jgi:uncharacterized membrane protein